MRIKSQWMKMGGDLLVRVEGGKSHIGCCVMAEPWEDREGGRHATLSTLSRLTHKDDVIASRYAKAICQKTGQTVVCVCGIHFDDFSEAMLSEILLEADRDIERILRDLESSSV